MKRPALPPISAHALSVLWPIYTEAVFARLHCGASEYGDGSFAKPLAVLVEEIRQELRDVSGWSFILDCRLVKILERIDALQALFDRANETAKSDIPG
jgi:hypothetical protein